MKQYIKCLIYFLMLTPFVAVSQGKKSADTLTGGIDSLQLNDSTHLARKDTVIVTDTVVAVMKTCYAEWLDAFRLRGAKPVTDGMQQIVIAMKDDQNCRCFMGQIEVVGGKMKPPLYFQKESGEYSMVSLVGKKIEPAFAGSMAPDELYAIKDGMSIVFRTTDGEYGRLFFYKFLNKSGHSNKEAPSPSELIKD